jgi:hypothetical protein
VQRRAHYRLLFGSDKHRSHQLCGWSKRRRVASEFEVWSWWPERVIRPFTASLFRRPAQQRLFVHAQISLCNYTLPPLPSANTLSLILHKRRITSISQQHFHNQRVCCDHQFTDRCSERESPIRPRSSPLRLDPQASPTALRAGPCTQQPHSTHLIRSTAPSRIMSPLLD